MAFFVFIVAAKCLFIYLDVTDYLKFLDIFFSALFSTFLFFLFFVITLNSLFRVINRIVMT